MQGFDYLEENKTQLRFSEPKEVTMRKAAAQRAAEPEKRGPEPVREPVFEDPSSSHEDERVQEPKTYGKSISDRFKNIWDKLLEATDEQLDDN